VDQFVEFFGEGLAEMTWRSRHVANMAPNTAPPWDSSHRCGNAALLRQTAARRGDRPRGALRKEQGIFRSSDTPDPEFTDVLELDLATVEPAWRAQASQTRSADADEADVHRALAAPVKERALACRRRDGTNRQLQVNGSSASWVTERWYRGHHLLHQHLQPFRHAGAGLVARRRWQGLQVPHYVKTSSRPFQSGHRIFAGSGIAGITQRVTL